MYDRLLLLQCCALTCKLGNYRCCVARALTWFNSQHVETAPSQITLALDRTAGTGRWFDPIWSFCISVGVRGPGGNRTQRVDSSYGQSKTLGPSPARSAVLTHLRLNGS